MSKIYRLFRQQNLPLEPEAAWKFFSSPRNLQDITPPWLGFTIESDVETQMYAGQIFIYTIRLFPGISFRWVTEITHVCNGEYFVDEQRFGPYTFWHHQHHFTPAEGGITMTDIVHYKIPLGWIGDLLHILSIKRQVRNIFDYREQKLRQKFGN